MSAAEGNVTVADCCRVANVARKMGTRRSYPKAGHSGDARYLEQESTVALLVHQGPFERLFDGKVAEDEGGRRSRWSDAGFPD
jgi:hypothetical protein